MKKRILISFSAIVAVSLFFIACNSKYPGFTKTDSGIYYKFYTENKDSLKPVEGNLMTLKIRWRTKVNEKDSVLYDSKDNKKDFIVPLTKPGYKGDLYEALAMVHKGDSVTFVIKADSFYIKTARYPEVPKIIDSTTMLYFDIKVVNIESTEQIEKARKAEAAILQKAEPEKLNKYLAANNITTKPLPSGLYFTETKAGTGKSIAKGDMVKLNFSVSLIEGKELFSTIQNGGPMPVEFGKPFENKGLEEAVGLMKKGGKAKVIVPSSLAFGEQGRGQMVAPYSTLLYDVEVVDVTTKAQYDKEKAVAQKKVEQDAAKAKTEETGMLQKYLKDNNITAKPLASGLYYIEVKKGSGAKAVKGKSVSVHYTGRLLNGTVFDSSVDKKKPLDFVLGQGQVIPGWDEGVALMQVGGKAKLIVPSKLGYGSQAMGDNIPAYSTLVFDVELLGVK
ncbi:MAG: FKBP-type peptidyl-prolyl cis-trans isomerase [Bacteroidales bacterium]